MFPLSFHDATALPFTRPLTVFLSSTFQEFQEARILITKQLEKHYIRAFVYEHAVGAAQDDVLHTSTKAVEDCDILVALFGSRYGEGTIDEYRHARRKAKPCLVYIRQTNEREPRLQEFLDSEILRWKGSITSAYFTDIIQLAEMVARDVLACLMEAYRHSNRKLPPRALPDVARLAVDVHDWFKTLGDEVSDPVFIDGNTMDLCRRRNIEMEGVGAVYQEILVRCVAGRLTSDETRRFLEDMRAGPSPRGQLIAELAVMPPARTEAAGRNDVSLLTFEELLDQRVHLDEYLSWLENEIRTLGVDSNYINLACSDQDPDPKTGVLMPRALFTAAEGGIDKFVDLWMLDPRHEHLSILGEFGTGKTWFLLHYALECLRCYQQAKQRGLPRPRLPLVIPLRGFTKTDDIEQLLTNYFLRKHTSEQFGREAFRQLNRMGKLLLLFDGFDEMSARVDRQQTINNFWAFARVLVPGGKVILTCRTEHFPEVKEGRALLMGELRDLTADLSGERPQFEVIHIEPFNEEQIRQALKNRGASPEIVEKIMANENLRDLARRPLLVDLILDALDIVNEGAPVDVARVYLYAMRAKLGKIDQARTFTSPADKLYFLSEVCWELLSKNQPSLNYRQIPDHVCRLFGPGVAEEKEIDHWAYDMRRNTILIHNTEGDYAPAHRSLIEFFVAYKFVAELGVLAEDFLELARGQSHIDPQKPPQAYRWSDYFRREVDAERRPTLIAPLSRFACVDFTEARSGAAGNPVFVETLTPNALLFAANMVATDFASLDRLCEMAWQNTANQAWNALSLLPFLKGRHAETLAMGLVARAGDGPLGSGVCWVLGELGVDIPPVRGALERTMTSFRDGTGAKASAWWEAAFALEKLGALGARTKRQGDEAVRKLVATLPPTCTLDEAFDGLLSILKGSGDSSRMKPPYIVTLARHESDATKARVVDQLLPHVGFAHDGHGRRVYYMTWLCGHFGIRESLDGLIAAACGHSLSSVRNCATEALGKLGIVDADVQSTLIRSLADRYYRTRFHAAWSLGELKVVDALPELERAIRGEDVLDVRKEMIRVRDALLPLSAGR